MNTAEIKQRLEDSKSFKYLSKEHGISFDDFSIIDVQNGRVLKKGDGSIGEFCIFIDGNLMRACYDMDIEGAREKRLQRVGKETVR